MLENDRTASARDPYLNFMQGLRATHEGDPGRLVAMGHSYGSTVVGESAATGRLPVDDVVVGGSPGLHVENAGQVMDDTRHVWAGVSDSDPSRKPPMPVGAHVFPLAWAHGMGLAEDWRGS